MSDLLVLSTHAIQYQAPLFQYLSQKSGVDLHVAFMQPPDTERPMWNKDFSRYIQWDIPLTNGYQWSTLPDAPLMRRLISFSQLHKSLNFPPIMLTSWATPFHWLVWTWAIFSNIPVILLTETTKQSYLLGRKPYWRHFWLKALLHQTTGFLYIGKRNKDFYSWIGVQESKMFFCPYSVDNERFANTKQHFLPERNAKLATLGLNPNLPTLLFSGKLIPKNAPIYCSKRLRQVTLDI